MALRARPIAASTRLLPSRWWRRTAGPQPKQVLGYLAASGPLMEARSRDRSGSWRPFGLTGEASPPYSSTPYATGYGEARRSGIVQGRQCDRALLVPAVVLCGCAGSARVSLAVHVWRRETARLAGTIGSSPTRAGGGWFHRPSGGCKRCLLPLLQPQSSQGDEHSAYADQQVCSKHLPSSVRLRFLQTKCIVLRVGEAVFVHQIESLLGLLQVGGCTTCPCAKASGRFWPSAGARSRGRRCHVR